MKQQEPVDVEDMGQSESFFQAARHCLQEYLRDLGITDKKLIEKLATDCVSKAAALSIPKESASKLKQRSLQEMLAMLDHLMLEALGNGIRIDSATMNASRAAFLLALPKEMLENALKGMEANESTQLAAHIRRSMPVPTPPEVPSSMTAQKLSFYLFKSTP